MFAIDVKGARALEWSVSLEDWSLLHRDSVIEDSVFAAPLPIDALARAAETDDAVARALIIKRNAVIEAARAESLPHGFTRGRAEGLAEGTSAAGLKRSSSYSMCVASRRGPTNTLGSWASEIP